MILASGRNPAVLIPALLTLMFVAITVLAGHTAESRQRTIFLSPTEPLTVVAGKTPATLALGTSRRFYQRAPIVVVVSATDGEAQRLGVTAATQLRAPVLIDDAGVGAELKRLKTEQVVVIGKVDKSPIPKDAKMTVSPRPGAVAKAVAAIKDGTVYAAPPVPTSDALVVTGSTRRDAIAIANAGNAGATIIEVPGGDPLRVPAAATLLKQRADDPVLALGDSFRRNFSYTLSVVRTAPEQIGGGYFVFPGRVIVALYGHPGTGSLGVLGERGIQATIARAKRTAQSYQRFTKQPVVPAFEIIATIASAGAGKDKDYSNEAAVAKLRPWVAAAGKAGVYVVLDLQPGRSDFLSQAKRYESLLALPHVGLALDPEWRLKKNEKHLRQIGSVRISEINRTSDWLAGLTRRHALPQKLLILHQFQQQMIRGRSRLDNTHPELAILIHVDGQGSQPAKRDTWKLMHRGAPKGVFWGWKNFYTEDQPMLSPKKTWTEVKPRPEFISYQ